VTDHSSGHRGPALLVLLLAALLLSGCGDPQEVIQSGTTGTNAQVGDILLRNVYVDEPPDPAYEPGADPRVVLTLVNQGDRPDTLVRVTTPVARAVEIRWDRDCDGAAELLPQLPVPAEVDLPSPPNAPGPLQSGYHLRLVDLTQEVLAGASVPLTFTFTDAGTTTVEAKVDLPGTGRAEPGTRCTPTPSG
jgi:copper(I)-binding protein